VPFFTFKRQLKSCYGGGRYIRYFFGSGSNLSIGQWQYNISFFGILAIKKGFMDW